MITQKQIEASRARVKVLQYAIDRAVVKLQAALKKHDVLRMAYYRQRDQQRREDEGKKGPE